MSDYTPTTEEIRAGYSTATYDDAKAEAEFDRWLAEVKAEAWQEGWDIGASTVVNYALNGSPSLPENPYEVAA